MAQFVQVFLKTQAQTIAGLSSGYGKTLSPAEYAVSPTSTWAWAFHQLHLMLLVPSEHPLFVALAFALNFSTFLFTTEE